MGEQQFPTASTTVLQIQNFVAPHADTLSLHGCGAIFGIRPGANFGMRCGWCVGLTTVKMPDVAGAWKSWHNIEVCKNEFVSNFRLEASDIAATPTSILKNS